MIDLMDVNYSQPNRRDKCTEIPGIPMVDGYLIDDYGQILVMLALKSTKDKDNDYIETTQDILLINFNNQLIYLIPNNIYIFYMYINPTHLYINPNYSD